MGPIHVHTKTMIQSINTKSLRGGQRDQTQTQGGLYKSVLFQ